MSDKTELPIEWQKLAEIKAGCTIDTMDFGNQWAYNIAVNAAEYDFIQGAKAMRDAMEKMLKEKSEYYLSIASDVQKEDIERCVLMHKFSALCNELLTSITSLTPTQDEPTA